MFLPSAAKKKQEVDPAKVAARTVAGWITSELSNESKSFDLPKDTAAWDPNAVQVMVTEVQCNEPDCVPIETLVICIGKDKTQRWMTKILKPILEVTQEDVIELQIRQCWEGVLSEESQNHVKAASEAPDAGSTETSTTTVAAPENVPNTANAVKVVMRRKVAPPHPPVADTTLTAPISGGVRAPAPGAPNPVVITPAAPVSNKTISSTDSTINKATIVSKPITSAASSRPPMRSGGHQSTSVIPESRHGSKGSSTRPRGCPCCDPDNMDNILDKMLYMDTPI